MTENNSPKAQMSRTRLILSAASVVLMFLGLVFFLSGPMIDKAVTETLICQVTGAQASKSGGGRGATLTVVEIKTRDCGIFGTYTGVNYQNAGEVAAAIRPGVYEVEIGWYSRYFVSLWPDGLPTINSYRRLGPLPASGSSTGSQDSTADGRVMTTAPPDVVDSVAAGLIFA
ncbi:hypothetical protein ACO03V_11185 [Microbacterium sp. HMH0099]|uniref:hypothetical protein n=1 Tax=Microbacterium sp. HMH0099 TaxID=3414026 RepID=UPI003BF6880C